MSDAGRVEVVSPELAPGVVSVLSEAFRDYPVMRFVLGDGGDYDSRLERLVSFFVGARVQRRETMLGIGRPGDLRAVALISRPDDRSDPRALQELREVTWASLGADARSRYEAFGGATAAFDVDVPHLHLNMIGVRPAYAGRGLGRVLLDAVHGRSAADPGSTGVSLTTEVRSNVSLYEHFGYEVIGDAPVQSAFTTWGMFRRDR